MKATQLNTLIISMFLTDVNNTRKLQDPLLLVVPTDSPRVAFSYQAPYMDHCGLCPMTVFL